ncbi:hypothetical protein AXG93_3559s1060 [Marchantia polymorpha subsp. ruderalis]|uniref:Uncharacterized protein n=1 Tax=Marchantia polymorpha subsp. ruderalis TaxID=1480154 RepID=A0A176WL00_MARPO|nr:hypothetical protein AXG93_3559s1060 [Marchantia polymorpha subsp. ruderalis]
MRRIDGSGEDAFDESVLREESSAGDDTSLGADRAASDGGGGAAAAAGGPRGGGGGGADEHLREVFTFGDAIAELELGGGRFRSGREWWK